jgi:RNA-binding protein Nova
VIEDACDRSKVETLPELEPVENRGVFTIVKILCPWHIAGALIGKGGATIVSMVDASRAKIKFSQNSELYPGTTDRIVIIQGAQQCVDKAIEELVSRLCQVSYLLVQAY